MAIDTREKRASVTGVGRPWMRDKEPEALKDEAWRLSSGLVYAGNTLAAAVTLLKKTRTFSWLQKATVS